MSAVTKDQILDALRAVKDPAQNRDLVSSGMIAGVRVGDNGEVSFMIEVDPARGSALEPLRQEAEACVAALDGVGKVNAVLTAHQKSHLSAGSAPDPHGMEKNPKLSLPIKHIIAVASGKGGVGKSTVAANVARQLSKSGLKAGLLDADIYGPSVPKMMGVEGRKPEMDKATKQLLPIDVHGLKVMSIGFMLENEAPLVWRGPMVQSAVYQMFRDVHWGEKDDPLDVLIVDMPPGTGDAQLTLAQKVPVAGAIIVSTPQDIALIDARKAIGMFEKVGVSILGLVENMSTYTCSNCGHEEHIFGHGGARDEAAKRGVLFLGEIPLDRYIRTRSDEGLIVEGEEDAPYAAIAGAIKSKYF